MDHLVRLTASHFSRRAMQGGLPCWPSFYLSLLERYRQHRLRNRRERQAVTRSRLLVLQASLAFLSNLRA